MLDEVEEIAKSIPPVDNSASRFGNPAFKTFYDRVQEVRRRPPATTSVSLFSPLTIRPFSNLPRYTPNIYPPWPKRPNLRCANTFTNAGETVQESTMEAEWSSTFFVGCEWSFDAHSPRSALTLTLCRLCLRKTGVLTREDNQNVVLSIFWR